MTHQPGLNTKANKDNAENEICYVAINAETGEILLTKKPPTQREVFYS